MTNRSRLTCVFALVVASLIAVAAAASPVDKRTTFTFNGPVAVPGVTLPAGSYVFRLANPYTSHDVVQVLSADGKTPYAMFFALQAWRSEPARDPELRFMETAADMPHAVRTWWSAGESIGYEFLYPRDQARLLAAGSGTPVLSNRVIPEWTEPEWVVPEFNPEAMPEDLYAEEAAVGEAAPIALPEAAPVEELPKTDSPTMTLLFMGVGALALSLVVRGLRTARA